MTKKTAKKVMDKKYDTDRTYSSIAIARHTRKQSFALKVITILIPLATIEIYVFKDWLIDFAYHLPACPFYTLYDIYCPSCGNTRSVSALLHGKVITSLRYNITPILLLLLCIGVYIELVAYRFGKPIRILPKKSIIYIIGGLLFIAYLIVRNFIPYLTP